MNDRHWKFSLYHMDNRIDSTPTQINEAPNCSSLILPSMIAHTLCCSLLNSKFLSSLGSTGMVNVFPMRELIPTQYCLQNMLDKCLLK